MESSRSSSLGATVGQLWSELTIHANDSPVTALHLAALVGILLFAYLLRLIYRPLNRVRDLSDIGFWHLKDHDKRGWKLRELANENLRRRQKSTTDLPPVYPNGWFLVAETRDLKRGQTRPLSVLGKELVLFRGEDGHSAILDAYCPHLGAHMGVGSRVLGNCIECPFHGWRFRGEDGKCTGIPYAEKVPDFAKVKKWHSREMNGNIYLWFHAEDQEPYWEPVEIPGIASGQLVYRGRTEHFIRAHIQEIPENGADIAHLAQLHKANLLSGIDLRNIHGRIWDVASHVWEASWKPGEPPTSHIANLTVNHSVKLFGKFNLMNLHVDVRQVGPALVYLEFETYFGKACLMHNVTPVEPMLQKVVHTLYCTPSMPVLYSKMVVLGEAIMFERDIMVWNHKVFLTKPLLVKEDKFIAKMRRWYLQFYSENSPRRRFQKDSLEW